MKCSSSLLITAYKIWRSPKGVPISRSSKQTLGARRTETDGNTSPSSFPLSSPRGGRYPHTRDPSDTPEGAHRAAETQLTAYPTGSGRSDVSAPGEARGSERSTVCPHTQKPSIQAGRRPDQPRAMGKPMPLCLTDWPKRWDPHTQSKKMSSRKAGKTRRSSPCPGRGGWRLGLELPGRTSTPQRTVHPSSRTPPFSCLGTTPPSCPQDPSTAGHVRRGADRSSPGWRCVYVADALWLEAKAILAGRGPVWSWARGEVFPAQGTASRRRAPCGNPSKDDCGEAGGQTIGTNSSDQHQHILNRFSVSAGHVARRQPGGLPAVCWEVSVGSAGWPLATPLLSCGLLAGLLLGVQRIPPKTG